MALSRFTEILRCWLNGASDWLTDMARAEDAHTREPDFVFRSRQPRHPNDAAMIDGARQSITGTAKEAKRAVDLGCYFSVNAEMLVNEKRAAITKALPLDRILTETDGPFTQTSGHPSTPSDVRVRALRLGAVLQPRKVGSRPRLQSLKTGKPCILILLLPERRRR